MRVAIALLVAAQAVFAAEEPVVVAQRSAAAGFDRHLVKPVEPAALSAMLASLPAARAESVANQKRG